MNIFTLPVFPPADVFPMMADEELQELALDIKENGLRDPLVIGTVDDAEVLVDGRNRRAACKIAEVQPTTRHLNGEDPTAFVLSANIHRRHLTKGQRAMAVAMIYPEPQKRGRGNKSSVSDEFVSHTRIKVARAVRDYSLPVAWAVLAGTVSLDEAYKQAQLASGQLNNTTVRLRALRIERPDLADKVEAEEMTLDDAVKKAADDAEAEKSLRQVWTRNLIDGVRFLSGEVEHAPRLAQKYDAAWAAGFNEKITPERLRQTAIFVTALADAFAKGASE